MAHPVAHLLGAACRGVTPKLHGPIGGFLLGATAAGCTCSLSFERKNSIAQDGAQQRTPSERASPRQRCFRERGPVPRRPPTKGQEGARQPRGTAPRSVRMAACWGRGQELAWSPPEWGIAD